MPTDPFDIAASGDDARASGSGASYPPAFSSTHGGETTIEVSRYLSGGTTFVISNGLLRFDTSAIPDGATITAAELLLDVVTKGDVDNRAICAGYYAFDGSVASTDYETTAETDAIAGVDITGITTGAVVSFPLQNLGSISKTGFTGLRLHVSGGQPTGFNFITFASLDHATLAAPRLSVTYTDPATGESKRLLLLGAA